MENFIINMLNEFKMNINAAALIQIGIILLLTVAALIVLHIVSKKIRAKLFATIQEMPRAFTTSGACSLEEPQPKLCPATIISPG